VRRDRGPSTCRRAARQHQTFRGQNAAAHIAGYGVVRREERERHVEFARAHLLHELRPEVGAQHRLKTGEPARQTLDRCDEARLREHVRQPDAEGSAGFRVLRAARLEIVHDAQHVPAAVEHGAAFTRNPPRFHATIEQRRLQYRLEALDLPRDRRRRQEQPLGGALQRT
jgi:hypothetical protein